MNLADLPAEPHALRVAGPVLKKKPQGKRAKKQGTGMRLCPGSLTLSEWSKNAGSSIPVFRFQPGSFCAVFFGPLWTAAGLLSLRTESVFTGGVYGEAQRGSDGRKPVKEKGEPGRNRLEGSGFLPDFSDIFENCLKRERSWPLCGIIKIVL